MSKDNIKSQAWKDLLRGEDVDRAATRVNDKSHIRTSIVDVEFDKKTGDRIYKERDKKEWK